MTSYFPFVPNVQSPFSFQPLLDGATYTATVAWNLFGQRWYVNLTRLTGTPVFTLPLIGSPDGVGIESASWAFGAVTVVTDRAHGLTIGETVALTISNCAPSEYNGLVLCQIVDPLTFTYQLAANPGDATQLGSVIYNINLGAGYFTTSTFVYRESSHTFEVSP